MELSLTSLVSPRRSASRYVVGCVPSEGRGGEARAGLSVGRPETWNHFSPYSRAPSLALSDT